MIAIIAIVVLTIWCLMETIYRYQGEITIVPIKGIMFGTLYNSEELEGNETEHIVQILFFVFSLNFVWITE
jgi:hypothetical protein